MTSSLSKRQSDILFFIKGFIQEHRISPSIQEICSHFGFASTNAVYEVLVILEKKGYISRGSKGKSRTITINDVEADSSSANTLPSSVQQLSIIGKGSSQNPLSVFMQPKGLLLVDSQFFQLSDGQHFCAYAPEESMQDRGIFRGDALVVQQTQKPPNGAIVLALMNDLTVMRVFSQKGKDIELSAEKKGIPKVLFKVGDSSVHILGVVKGVMRTV